MTPYVYQLNKTCYLISDGSAESMSDDQLIRAAKSARHESVCDLESYVTVPRGLTGVLWRKVATG